MFEPSPFVADIGPLPSDPDPSSIGSVGKYLFLSHLVRTPLVMNRSGQIESGLADSWSHNDEFTEFTLTFPQDQKFSDGSSITTKSFFQTVEFRRALKAQIHFDFNLVEESTLSQNVVTLRLQRSSPLFLMNLTQPEFGILHESTRLHPEKGPIVSSGYYKLDSFSANEIQFSKNQFTDFLGPSKLNFRNTGSEKYGEIEKENLHFILEFNDIPAERAQIGERRYEFVEPHIGFTHWLTLNAKTGVLSDWSARRTLQAELFRGFSKSVASTTINNSAKQLFLPGGPGRMTDSAADNLWSEILTNIPLNGSSQLAGANLKFAIAETFPLRKQLEKAISESEVKLGFTSKLVIYQNSQELQALASTGAFDVLQTNNDFSGYDLTSNVAVTFNPQRPLILSTPSLEKILSDLATEKDADKRAFLLERISEAVIGDSLIVPLIHKRATFIKIKALDIESWSTIFPEISFWKASWIGNP